MAGIIDTNILLYAVNRDAKEHPGAVDFLTAAGTGHDRWYFTEGILYEFFRVTTHPKVFERPLTWREALQFLEPFLRSPNFDIVHAGEKHWGFLEHILSELNYPSGNLFFDIRTTALMREHGIREIYSADTDFLQFSGIKVINPVKNP